ncbi:MAG TPA: CBS domain-containing protein [Baekduia sp.]|uniref:CBS domain-containing protein n=1 Tax=Baekduia sp. TaxID=2600305 RepID=UPI002C53B028|nr:CBS domain-containing protein [Baekduia sp.]HMJ33250.1 CBS domain-containing protein [Baekduia sp.]
MAATVADIMERDAPSITLDAGVEDVVARFRDEDVSALPVVNDGGRCVGIVTEQDLVIADEEGDLHIPHYIELFGGLVFFPPELRVFERRLRKAAAARVADLMTEPPVTVEPSTTLHEAAHAIVERGHSRLPVVEHGRYVGLVTRADVLAALNALEA